MDREIVVRLHASFEDMVRTHAESGTEYWLARDLQMLLGYAQWRYFEAVIMKAITSCKKCWLRSGGPFCAYAQNGRAWLGRPTRDCGSRFDPLRLLPDRPERRSDQRANRVQPEHASKVGVGEVLQTEHGPNIQTRHPDQIVSDRSPDQHCCAVKFLRLLQPEEGIMGVTHHLTFRANGAVAITRQWSAFCSTALSILPTDYQAGPSRLPA